MNVCAGPAVTFLLTLSAVAQTSTIAPPPPTPRQPVTDEYHGVKVTDDYRWLENWDDPAVKQWSAAQDARTRGYLAQLPAYPAIHARIAQLIGNPSVSYDSLQFSGGLLFALQYLPKQQQPLLVTLPSPDEPSRAKVILDPNRLSDRGAIAISFFTPSSDGKYVAVVLSKDETEDGSAHIFKVATGKELADVLPRVLYPTAYGSIAWKVDDFETSPIKFDDAEVVREFATSKDGTYSYEHYPAQDNEARWHQSRAVDRLWRLWRE
jgi:prolyl oligopeptidase